MSINHTTGVMSAVAVGGLSGIEGGESRSGGEAVRTEGSYLHEDRKFISENLSSIFDRSAIDKTDACCDLDHIHFSPGECVLCGVNSKQQQQHQRRQRTSERPSSALGLCHTQSSRI
jgi:hypothetical protein